MAYVARTASTESASHPGWNAIATCRERNSLQLRTSARLTSSATTAPTVSCTAQTQGPGKVRCGGRAALSAGAVKRGPIQLGVAAGGGPPPPHRGRAAAAPPPAGRPPRGGGGGAARRGRPRRARPPPGPPTPPPPAPPP